MSYTKNIIAIDGQKLREIFHRKNINQTQVSIELGYSASYMSTMCKSNKMRKSTMDYLFTQYGIKPMLYMPNVYAENTEKHEDKKLSDISADEYFKELHKTIYSAVYEAVKKALQE